MFVDISIRADVKAITKKLDNLAYQQVPFATARALTALADRVVDGERKAIQDTFRYGGKPPRPFTVNSIGRRAATKTSQTAIVFVKDIAAQYLAPYEDGGSHFLGKKRGILYPKDISTDAYGNLPRNALKRLKGRKDIFIGSVTFKKSGQTINGVWQRPARGQRRGIKTVEHGRIKGRIGTKGAINTTGGQMTGLKLLIRFGDTMPVKQHLGYHQRAERIVREGFDKEFGAALARAMATAR